MQSRRNFLLHASTLCLGAASWSHLCAKPPSINLGFSLYGMKSLPLNEALRICAQNGFTNVEISLLPGFPTEPKSFGKEQRSELRSQLAKNQLSVSGWMLNLSLAVDDNAHAKHLEALTAGIEMARDVLPDQAPLFETVLGGKPSEWESIRESMAKRLTDWSAIAAQHQAVIAIKAHVASAVNHPERLLWLLDRVQNPSIQVAYDFSHFQLHGLALEETLKPLIARTRFIHIKDAQGDHQKFRFLLPGEGTIDYAVYFKLLIASGYTGPVVVEVSGQIFNQPGYDPSQAVEKCRSALATALPS